MTPLSEVPDTREWFTMAHLISIGIVFSCGRAAINRRCQMPMEIGQLIDHEGRIIPGCYQTQTVKIEGETEWMK